jgi:hypothetical protein
MVYSLQLTFGSTGAISLSTLFPNKQNMMASFAIFQGTGGSGNARLGDSTVSATKGIMIVLGNPGGSASVPLSISRCFLPGYSIYAPSGAVIDIMYEDN